MEVGSSFLRDGVGLSACEQRPGGAHVEYGKGVGGEAIEVVAGLVRGLLDVGLGRIHE